MSLTHIADQVDADGVVTPELHRQLQFGADAVGTRYQHRFAEAVGRSSNSAKATEPGHHAGRKVLFTIGLIRSTRAFPASMSTPAWA